MWVALARYEGGQPLSMDRQEPNPGATIGADAALTPDGDDKACSRARRAGIEEEQALCSEALESGDYDMFSDAAWIKLCEDVAAKSRVHEEPAGE